MVDLFAGSLRIFCRAEDMDLFVGCVDVLAAGLEEEAGLEETGLEVGVGLLVVESEGRGRQRRRGSTSSVEFGRR